MNKECFDWTIEREDILRNHWTEDYKSIARALGDEGLSRDAINKKGQRLGLGPRGPVGKRPSEKSLKQQRVAPDVFPTMADLLVRPAIGETVWTVKDGQCRYPFGDPRTRGFYLCGNEATKVVVGTDTKGRPKVKPRAYCAMHCAITDTAPYKPPSDKIPYWMKG